MPSAESSLLSILGCSGTTTASRLRYHAFTMFLFSKSDFKTTIIPVSLFSLGAAPLSSTNSLSHAIQAVIWIWLHILKFNLANQVRDPEEDRYNKPWRPLPSGRISLENALLLKRQVTVACLLLSMCYSPTVFLASFFFAFLVPMYHEMHGDQHWLTKNLMNAMGYSCFAVGGTLIAASDRSQLDFIGARSIFVVAAILATTIQSQDFQDVEGDQMVGRRTLPIVFPRFSRYTPLITLTLWSLYLTSIWEISSLGSLMFTSLASIVGARFWLWRSATDDEWSYFLYNIWLITAFSMPGYWRLFKERAFQ